jgi:hypothetical protein
MKPKIIKKFPIRQIKKIESILMKSSKKKVITLRLNDDDLLQIKTIALSEGIPYQTLISSVMHKYINNRFIDRNEALKISEREYRFNNALNESKEIFKKWITKKGYDFNKLSQEDIEKIIGGE